MAYQVLARKYRPQQFADVVGQTHVTDTLRHAIETGRVAHAYLFVGPRGIGKTSIARILAKALNCAAGPTPTPCDRCDSCLEIMGARNLDVLEFDAASTTQVDKIREIIIDRVAYAPTRGPLKIYIIDEVHMLSVSSFNALLKTLEEPPSHVKFIFATTDPQKVPATIASRCQRFDLRRIARADIIGHLRTIAEAEKVTISEDALFAIARGAEGGLRDAESALDQLMAFCGSSIEEADVLAVFGLAARGELEALAADIIAGDIPGILRRIGALDAQGKALPRLVVELMEYFRDLLVLAYDPDGRDFDLPEAHREALAKHAAAIEPARVLRMVDLLSEAENGIRHALSQKTMLEVALVRCARAARTVTLEELLRRLQDFREGLGPVTGPGTGPVTNNAELEAKTAHPPSSDPPTPPLPPGPTLDPEKEREALKANWVALADEVASVVPRARAALLDSRVLRVEETRVTLGVDPALAVEIAVLEEPRHARSLERTLTRHLGRRVVARIERLPPGVPAAADRPVIPPVESPGDPPAETENASPEAKASLRKRVLEDPGVRRALDLFDGTVVDVRGE